VLPRPTMSLRVVISLMMYPLELAADQFSTSNGGAMN